MPKQCRLLDEGFKINDCQWLCTQTELSRLRMKRLSQGLGIGIGSVLHDREDQKFYQIGVLQYSLKSVVRAGMDQ